MANPETTTPSVEGDRLEAIARIIDPYHWPRYDYQKRQYGKAHADQMYGAELEPSLAKARQIAALPCKGGEPADPRVLDRLDDMWRTLMDCGESGVLLAHSVAREHGEDLGVALEWLDEGKIAATPTTEPDTVRGLREALEALTVAEDTLSRFPFTAEFWPNGMHPNTGITLIRDALAALSDTPRAGT